MKTEYASLEEWHEEGQRLFGPDEMEWSFSCPSCGHEAKVKDWKAVGAPQGAVAFSCVGAYIEDSKKFGERPGPCNYIGAGLFRINPVKITGRESKVFQFSDAVRGEG